MALKAEMARFNNAGMHRPQGHHMDFIPFYPIKVRHTDSRIFVSAPGIVPRAVRLVKTEGLEPRMAFRAQSPLLGNLTLKRLNLRALWSQRGERLAGHTAFDDMHYAVSIVGQDRPQFNFLIGLGCAKKGGHAPAIRDGIN